jgi:hypothetical protein
LKNEAMFYDIYKNSSLSATFPGWSEAVTVIPRQGGVSNFMIRDNKRL